MSQSNPIRFLTSRYLVWLVLVFLKLGFSELAAHEAKKSEQQEGNYAKPKSASSVEGTDPNAALDEAMSGHTLLGTPVRKRGVEEFPAEHRDVFWQMDQVASGPGGALEVLSFDKDGDGKLGAVGEIGKTESDAVKGRNTWLLWGGGNEAFWGWLQERGYGLVDFLVVMDGRRRGDRFLRTGAINQPGFAVNTDQNPSLLGLYLDKPVKEKVRLTTPVIDPATGRPKVENGKIVSESIKSYYEDKNHKPLFEEGKDETAQKMLKAVREWFAESDDGLYPDVYGYPSGIFGLRLMLNPDFFGSTKAAAEARQYWKARVMDPTHSSYYADPKVNADPKLVRPFRVSMACGFCHVGPHPMNPPADAENPEWENLSSIIGSQYWRPQPLAGNLLKQDNFIYHFLASQAPGTIDTSLVSTDHINNTNTINGIFEVPARFARAHVNATETQSAANLLVPSIEDPGRPNDQRHFPRILVDGSDSTGGFAAFIRVPLNVGTYSEQWANCHNPVIGFRNQKPFSIASSQKNSIYWQVNEKYRVPYLANFFTYQSKQRPYAPAANPEVTLSAQNSTRAMKLLYAGPKEMDSATGKPVGRAELDKHDNATRAKGREVFLQNCAICHSSKQPEGFNLAFTRDEEKVPADGWRNAPAPPLNNDKTRGTPHYTLPMDFALWGFFKESNAYKDYVSRIKEVANAGVSPEKLSTGFELDEIDPFIQDNFLSTEVRIPVTLVGTNSARATATNAVKGHVWDNFSSETYKNLPAVGEVHYYNPYINKPADEFGNNATYKPKEGGPGYYRPATLASLWSTAPFIHNNTVGGFYPQRDGEKVANPTTVRGRLDAFDDAIRKVLWKKYRTQESLVPGVTFESVPGDLRRTHPWATRDEKGNSDPGYIYRLPNTTYISFEGAFIEPLVKGVAGPVIFGILQWGIWLALLALWVILYFKGNARHVGILFLIIGLLVAGVCLLAGVGNMSGTTLGVLLAASTGMLSVPAALLWGIAILFIALGIAFLSGARLRWLGWLTVVLLLVALVGIVALIISRALGLNILFLPVTINRIPVWFLWVLFGLAAVLAVLTYALRNRSDFSEKTVFATLALGAIAGCVATHGFLSGGFGGISVGPIPKGVPVNLVMNLDPHKGPQVARGIVAMTKASVHIKKNNLSDEEAYRYFADKAGALLMEASTCPDFVLDRGHWFGEYLTDEEKESLIAFLKTL